MIALVIGHTITNKGASYQQKVYEYDYNVELAQKIKRILLSEKKQVAIIDNEYDYNLGMKSKDILAQAIVDGINKFIATI